MGGIEVTTPTNNRPWTAGPWLYRAKSGSWHVAPEPGSPYKYGTEFITTPDSCDMTFRNEADAALIALAPELAEAVLAAEATDYTSQRHVLMREAKAKLRAIGEEA